MIVARRSVFVFGNRTLDSCTSGSKKRPLFLPLKREKEEEKEKGLSDAAPLRPKSRNRGTWKRDFLAV